MVGADRVETFVGASFIVILVAFAAQRFLADGPTHFLRRPAVLEVEALEDDLHRIRARAGVQSGREWLALELLPSLMRERADDGLIVHGPVVAWVDEQVERRFARAVRIPAH